MIPLDFIGYALLNCIACLPLSWLLAWLFGEPVPPGGRSQD